MGSITEDLIKMYASYYGDANPWLTRAKDELSLHGNRALRYKDASGKYITGTLADLARLYLNDDGSWKDERGFADAYRYSKNLFGITKQDNPFSKVNLKGTLKSGALAASQATSPFVAKTVGGGYDASGVGNGVASIGASVGGAVGTSNPLLGAAITTGSAIIGGGINRVFGLKENTALKNRMNAGIETAENFRSNASSFDALRDAPSLGTAGNVYSKSSWGVGSAKRRMNRKNNALKNQFYTAQNTMLGQIKNNANLLSHKLMNNMLANYAALGGFLGDIPFGGAIGYQFTNDYISNGKSKAQGNAIIPNVLSNINAFGGNIGTHGSNFSTGLYHINKGGTHEENPNEGVPMGMDAQGIPNLVELGEVVDSKQDYVFSNRLTVPTNLFAGGGELDYSAKVLKPYGGKKYSDAAKAMEKASGVTERPNDPISEKTLRANLDTLTLSQEKVRAEELLKEMLQVILNMTPEQFQQFQQFQALMQLQLQQMIQPMPETQAMPLEQIPELMQSVSEEQVPVIEEPQMVQAYGGNLKANGGRLYAPGGPLLTLEQLMQLGINDIEYDTFKKLSPLRLYMILVGNYRVDPATIYGYNNKARQVINNAVKLTDNMDLYQRADIKDYNELVKEHPEYAYDYTPTVSIDDETLKSWDNDVRGNSNTNSNSSTSQSQNQAVESTTPRKNYYTDYDQKMIDLLDLYARLSTGDNTMSFERIVNGRGDNRIPRLAAKRWKEYRDPLGNQIFQSRNDAFNAFNTAFTGYRQAWDEANTERENYQNNLKLTTNDLNSLDGYTLKMIGAELGVNSNYTDDTKQQYINDIIKAIPSYDNGQFNKTSVNNLITLKADSPRFNNLFDEVNLTDADANNYLRYDNVYDVTSYGKQNWGGNLTNVNLDGFHYNDNTDSWMENGKVKVGNRYFNTAADYERDPAYWYPRYQMAKAMYDALLENPNDFDANTFFENNPLWKLYKDAVVQASGDPDYWKNNSGRFTLEALYGINDPNTLATMMASPEAHKQWLNSHKNPIPNSIWYDLRLNVGHGQFADVTSTGGNRLVYYLNGKYYKLKPGKTPADLVTEGITAAEPVNWNTNYLGYVAEQPNYTTKVIDLSSSFKPFDIGDEPIGYLGIPDNVTTKGKLNTVGPPFPMLSTVPFGLAAGLQTAGLAYNLLSPVNYDDYYAYMNKTKNQGYKGVHATPRPGYLAYRPVDRNHEARKIQEQALATNRYLVNNSGRNFGNASAGIMSNAYNMYNAIGNTDLQSELANREHQAKVFAANDAVNQGNSELLLKAGVADSEAYANAARTNAENLKGAYDLKYKLDKDRGDAISAGITGIANNIYNYSNQKYNNDLVKWSMWNGVYGPTKEYAQYAGRAAKGGPIRRRRKGISL